MKLLLASYFLVLIKVFQQRNVMHGDAVAMFFTSYIFAAADMIVIVTVVQQNSVAAWLALGTGGAFGGLTGLWLHKRMKKT